MLADVSLKGRNVRVSPISLKAVQQVLKAEGVRFKNLRGSPRLSNTDSLGLRVWLGTEKPCR